MIVNIIIENVEKNDGSFIERKLEVNEIKQIGKNLIIKFGNNETMTIREEHIFYINQLLIIKN